LFVSEGTTAVNVGAAGWAGFVLVRAWRHFYGGGSMGYGAVGYKPSKAVLK